MGRRERQSELSVSVQLMHLRRNPICSGEGALRPNCLSWRFACQPTPMARAYHIRIDYARGDHPIVTVLDPDLSALAAGRRIPHVYSEKPMRLCLYLPNAREWHSGLRLDETIVPWTYLWFDYFEEWLWSDDWKGGGTHPGGDDVAALGSHISTVI
jgi:hypothetical protein